MTRRLLSLLTALSLLLCVAECVLWLRSYWAYDRILYQTDENSLGVQRCFVLGWNRGALVFEHHHIAVADALGVFASVQVLAMSGAQRAVIGR